MERKEGQKQWEFEIAFYESEATDGKVAVACMQTNIRSVLPFLNFVAHLI